MTITYGEVFAGIGSANAAFKPLGWENKYFIENKPTALLQYLFNWDDEFYGGVLTSYAFHKKHNYNPKQMYARLLEMAKGWQSAEKKGDLYVINHLLERTTESSDYEAIRQSLQTDVCMTSPPCQSFSASGKRKGLEDKGDLFFETHKFLQLTQPKVFILENVPGMLTIREDIAFDDKADDYARDLDPRFQMYRYLQRQRTLFAKALPSRKTFYDIILPSLGVSANTTLYPQNVQIPVWRAKENKFVMLRPLPYHLKFLIISAPSFGSPMQRKRVFIVGFRTDLNSSSFQFNVPSMANRGVLTYINPDARLTRSFRYKMHAPGTWGYNAALGAKKVIDSAGLHYNPTAEPYIPTILTAQDPRTVAIKMKSGNYRTFADEQLRALMGFPPGFSSNIVSLTAAWLHYGNAIFVPALNHIGQQIQKVLKKNP